MPDSPDVEHNPWTTLSSEVRYDNPWIRVVHHEVLNPSGGEGIYGVVEFKRAAVGVIPIDEEGNTWLVGQFRYAHDQYEWEIPEGGGDPGEPYEMCARRELLEETGIKAETLEPIISDMQLSNSSTNEVGIVFVARGLTFGQACPEETEDLAVRKLPLSEAIQMAIDGEIHDSLSLAALLKARILGLG